MNELWILENVDIDEIFNDGAPLEIVRESVLTIELPDSPKAIIANTIAPGRNSRGGGRSYGPRGIEGYEDALAFELRSPVLSGGRSDGIGVKLTGINSQIYSEEDELFLLIEPVYELIEYINLDYPITFRSENPLTIESVFESLLVESIELVPEPTNILGVGVKSLEPVPELGTIAGLGVVAALCIAVGWALPTNLAMIRRRSPMKERNMLQRFTPARPTTFAKVYRKDNNNFIDKSTQQLKIATEYFSLAILPELSDAEADRLEEILELAQFDDHLSSLINKIDCFVLEELQCFEPDELERDNNQIARIKEFLVS